MLRTTNRHDTEPRATPPSASSLEVMVGGVRLVLLADRAIHWPEQQTLIVTDTHFGKTATFRALGVAAPESVTASDLERLDRVIALTRPKRLLHLGDLLHSVRGTTSTVETSLRGWRDRHPSLEIVLVRGNHDRGIASLAKRLEIDVMAPGFVDGGVQFTHMPEEIKPDRAPLVMHGHLHPCIGLKRSKESVRLRGFILGPEHGKPGQAPARVVLPAFGSFTGCRVVRLTSGERVVVTNDRELIPLLTGGARMERPPGTVLPT
ncbi:MAG: ligase-associated DNA damage response endonuclease PdeM [Planctomycetota bacterium]